MKRLQIIYIGMSCLYENGITRGLLTAEFDVNGFYKSFTKVNSIRYDNFDVAEILRICLYITMQIMYICYIGKKGYSLIKLTMGQDGTPYTYIKEDSLPLLMTYLQIYSNIFLLLVANVSEDNNSYGRSQLVFHHLES